MGRKAGGRNGANLGATEYKPIVITSDEFNAIKGNMTTINKDMISIKDFEVSLGLSYDLCAKIVREIKAVSDTFHISGKVHRVDYLVYLTRKFAIQQTTI